ncbi:GNAT family N-acetyltransferase [Actinoallomurus sp. NPDC050550]|uniref:GNAT family N-acetyltransferase n=1 Tax=Actinoallomurus sp. NPDC050550 TaxID=3154937 RepID=UPI0033D17947
MPPERAAVVSDIPELIRLRALLFGDLGATGWEAPPPGEDWLRACADALREQLTDDSVKILVIDGDTGLAACGIGAIDRRLPGPYNLSGLIGHVYGVVTDPAYRRRGHSRAIMEGLLGWFTDREVRRVNLNASPDGEPLYRSLGFTEHPAPTLSRKR